MPLKTEERIARIERLKLLIEDGASIAQLAQTIGVNENNMRKFLLSHGLVTKGMQAHRNHKED